MFDGATGVEMRGFFAHDAGFTGGVAVGFAARFHRLFGDVNGDAKVDWADLAALLAANRSYFTSCAYVSSLDFNGDGDINTVDYTQIIFIHQRHREQLNADGILSDLC